MLPSLFISHGSPRILLGNLPSKQFLEGVAATLPRPKAIVIATAHWLTRIPATGAAAKPETIYDFGHSEPRLFEMSYAAPGDPALAERVAHMIGDAGMQVGIDPQRGFDHGVWVPLRLMYPDAGIPVVPLAIQPYESPAHHIAVGRAIARLREEDVLVIGSGTFTHNLRRFYDETEESPQPPDVLAFSAYMEEALTSGDTTALENYRTDAPGAVLNHPTDEHLLPIFIAFGAGGEGAPARRIHASADRGVVRMDAYAFG